MFDFLEEILHQFKDVPGLQFLKKLHTRYLLARTAYARKRDRVRNFQHSIKGAASNVKGLRDKARSSKRRNAQ